MHKLFIKQSEIVFSNIQHICGFSAPSISRGKRRITYIQALRTVIS
jgi:hypothetical protein